VATAVNAVPDVVIPGESGLLVPPQQPALLGRAIGYLLEEPAQAARMAAYGRELLGDRFTPHTLATVLDQVYDPGRRPATRRGPVAPPRRPQDPETIAEGETAWT
jgi:glycosyltransferase involved in cell wall biosynthesis